MPIRRFSGPRYGSRIDRKNQYMRVWSAIFQDTTATSSPVTVTLADAASFATTSGNTKHIGTLVRIRGTVTWVGTASGVFGLGVRIKDVNEGFVSPPSTVYGQDEDLLYWTTGQAAVSGQTFVFDLDIKAKRRLDVESVVQLDWQSPTGFLVFNARCLFLVP